VTRRWKDARCAFRALAAAALLLGAPGLPPVLRAQTAEPGLTGALANGYRFAYLDGGTGPPVVLVHGGLTDYRYWAGQAPLEDYYRLLRYSRRHYFPNPYRPDDPASGVRTDAGDLVALVRTWRLERPVLVGHAAGATVALLAALRAPQLFAGLVLVEPVLDSLIADSALREQSARAERGAWAAARAAAEPRRPEAAFRALLEALYGPGTWDRVPADHQARLLENAATLVATDPGQPALSCAELGALRVPVRLLEGARTGARFRATDDGLLRCLPDARRELIPDAGHAAPWSHPAEFNPVLRRALDQLTR